MSGFLGGLFERKAASSTSGGQAVSHAVSQSPSRYGMYSSTGQWDIDKAVTDGFEKVLWVYRCVDAIASNQAALPILHRIGDAKTGRLVQSPQLMTLLNVRPNIYETAAMFRYRLSAQLLLSRKGAFIEIVGDPANPESLHLLPPQSVEPIPDARTFVSGYRVRGADMTQQELKPEQVIWIRLKPHPIDPYMQTTPLVAAGIAAETDFLARLFNRNFLLADGRPGLLVSIRGQLGNEDAMEIKRRFSGGPAMAGQTTVVEAEGLDVADLGATPRDAQWQEATRTSKEDILLAFGVPESILGNASGRTFDNADAEYEIFWRHTMVPHCDAIAGGLDAFTGNKYDDDVLAYDYDKVDVLQRQERARQQTIIERWAQGVITWDEMREALGLETWPDALAARIIVLPSGIAMAKTGEDQAGIMQLPNVQAPAAAGGPGDALSAIAQQGARLGAQQGARQMQNVLAARALQLAGKSAILHAEQVDGEGDAVPFQLKQDEDIVDAVIVHPYLAERKQLEATLDGLLIGMSSRQESVVLDRLMHAKVRKGTRHWEGETKADKPLDPFYVVEVERWVNDTRDDFQRVLTPVLKREAARVAKDMDASSLAAPSLPERQAIIKQTMDEVLAVVETSVRNQSNRIADKIRQYDAEGMSMDDIKSEVTKMVGTRSSWRKGLTGHVTTSAIEGVKHDVYSTAGAKLKKTWNTEDDEKVRDSHFFVDGKSISSHKLFHVGGTMMRFPGDPTAPVEEVANCRCWLTWSART